MSDKHAGAGAKATAKAGAKASAKAGLEESGPLAGIARNVSDPRSMRALAHPVRIALLELLTREGPLTATRAAELLDDSPGNMSWHLQTLAKYGYVEEAGGGRGRSRPWKVVGHTYNFETEMSDPTAAAAAEALDTSLHERQYRRLQEWWTDRRSYPAKWRKAAFSSDSLSYLTATELRKVNEEILEIMLRYRGRKEHKDQRPADALPVQLVAYGHPLRRTPEGN